MTQQPAWVAAHGICCYPPSPELCDGCPCHEPPEEEDGDA